MDLQKIVSPCSPSQLSHTLNERTTFDVSNGPSKFNNTHVWFALRVINWYPRNTLNPLLDCIGEMRDYLYRATFVVVASSFQIDDVLVHFTSRDVIFTSQGDIQISLVVS